MIRSVELIPPAEQEQRVGYPWDLPAIEALAEGLALHPRVTYLIGENDNGKSTLLESIALAAAMNAEGDLRTSPETCGGRVSSAGLVVPRTDSSCEPRVCSPQRRISRSSVRSGRTRCCLWG